MKEKYVLVNCREREIDAPVLYDSIEEARAAMKKALIDAMDGTDDSVFDDYIKDEDYNWEPDENSAWFNHRHGNRDWIVFSFDDILRETAKANVSAGENGNSRAQESYTLLMAFTVEITQQDIDDILCAAFEGGITYWCCKAEVVGGFLGKYAHEQISRGRTLLLHDAEEDKQYELTLDGFMKGLRLFLGGHSDLVVGNRIDPGDFDSDYADAVVQLALFGEVVYG